jgi:hypothetical protein
MTFEPIDYGDDDETEAGVEAAPRLLRPIRGPITRRRERRILAVLTFYGPLAEDQLYRLLGGREGRFTMPLLNLIADRLICYQMRPSLLGDSYRVWSLRARPNGEN